MDENIKKQLITQFRFRFGDHVSERTADFFLDMSGWNLQSAINCFLEVQWNTQVLPNMGFKQHLTMAEAVNYVLPNTCFTKIWQIYNNGEEKWPGGCQVVLAEGLNLSNLNSFPVPALIPGEIYEIRVNMISPQKPGLYESRWMMANPQGSFFGDQLLATINVTEEGSLDLAHQFAQFNLSN